MVKLDAARITVLGMGEMGRVLAIATARAGHATTVWNRSPGKADAALAAGASQAEDLTAALSAGPVVVACLLDHASVHETLDPHVELLAGKALVNLTSTSPQQSRELAAWAASHGIDYLDGGIMAIPAMIGQPGSSIFYSGSETVHRANKSLLDVWGESPYFGEDAGLAALWDFSILSAMYTMFAGFFHGAAMAGASGIDPRRFAERVAPYLSAMTQVIPAYAEIMASGAYPDGAQDLNFTKSVTDAIRQTSVDQGIDPVVFGTVAGLVDRGVADGNGGLAFEHVFEQLKKHDN